MMRMESVKFTGTNMLKYIVNELVLRRFCFVDSNGFTNEYTMSRGFRRKTLANASTSGAKSLSCGRMELSTLLILNSNTISVTLEGTVAVSQESEAVVQLSCEQIELHVGD